MLRLAFVLVILCRWRRRLSSSRAQTKPAPATIRIAYIPVANYTPMLIARDKGWFAEGNLNVTWSPISQGAIAVEAVFGGSAEIGGSSIFEPMVARGNGLDMMYRGCRHPHAEKPPDNSALLVRRTATSRPPRTSPERKSRPA